MHFHLPRPLHGWREFLGEVGIIVVGVLIALGAEQVVERISWNGAVNEAKQDLGAELQEDLFAAQERVRMESCIDQKLYQLGDIIDRPPAQRWTLLAGHNVVPIRVWATSAWDSAVADGAVAHMPRDERTRYAKVYSLVRGVHALALEEYPVSVEFRMLEHGGALSEVSQDRLRADLARMQGYNSILALGSRQASQEIQGLGIHLSADDEQELAEEPCPMPADGLPDRPRG